MCPPASSLASQRSEIDARDEDFYSASRELFPELRRWWREPFDGDAGREQVRCVPIIGAGDLGAQAAAFLVDPQPQDRLVEAVGERCLARRAHEELAKQGLERIGVLSAQPRAHHLAPELGEADRSRLRLIGLLLERRCRNAVDDSVCSMVAGLERIRSATALVPALNLDADGRQSAPRSHQTSTRVPREGLSR
jgi:hypothetical protein